MRLSRASCPDPWRDPGRPSGGSPARCPHRYRLSRDLLARLGTVRGNVRLLEIKVSNGLEGRARGLVAGFRCSALFRHSYPLAVVGSIRHLVSISRALLTVGRLCCFSTEPFSAVSCPYTRPMNVLRQRVQTRRLTTWLITHSSRRRLFRRPCALDVGTPGANHGYIRVAVSKRPPPPRHPETAEFTSIGRPAASISRRWSARRMSVRDDPTYPPPANERQRQRRPVSGAITLLPACCGRC